MRAFIFLFVIGLANYFVVAGLFDFAPVAHPPLYVPVGVALVLFVIEMLDLRASFLKESRLLTLCASIVTGTFMTVVLYVFVAEIVFLLALYFTDIPTERIQHSIFWAITGLTVATVPIGIFQALSGPKLKQVDVGVKNLPSAFENYKILQISDLHVGSTIRTAYIQNVVAMANKTDADLIALTGDFADGSVKALQNDSAFLGNLRSRDGIYFITGNHEYYHDLGNWLNFYRSLGFKVLNNRHEVISRGGDHLAIAGVNDYSTRTLNTPDRADIAAAAKDMPANAVKILLMHQPTQYKEAEAAGFDLQLSGHTHGGQFFPWNFVVRFFHDFYKGLGRYKNLNIYVSVGTGYWGPCVRTFVPPEITVLTLKSRN